MRLKHLIQGGMIYTSGCDIIHQMWDGYRKKARDNFSRKIKSTGFIYLPGSNVCESEGHLTMRSCLKDSNNNSTPRIGKYINKLKLYRIGPPRRVRDNFVSEIENTSCVRYVMRVTPVSGKEREPWGAACILRIVNYGVFICTCNVKYD